MSRMVRLFAGRRALMRILCILLVAGLIVLGGFLVGGTLGLCIALGLAVILGIQFWVASTSKRDLLLNAHILRGPPDGG